MFEVPRVGKMDKRQELKEAIEMKVGDIVTVDDWRPTYLRWWQIFTVQRYKTWRYQVMETFTGGYIE